MKRPAFEELERRHKLNTRIRTNFTIDKAKERMQLEVVTEATYMYSFQLTSIESLCTMVST